MNLSTQQMNMRTYEILFALIRSGLQIENANLDGVVNWENLYNIASEQGVAAIVAEGISHEFENGFSADDFDFSMRIQFIDELVSAEQTYLSFLQSATRLAELYHKHGIRTFCLKGFVTNSFYPKPKLRVFCDFDCFLGDFCKGNELAKQIGIDVAGSYKHATFNYEAIHVENHQFCTHFRGRKKAYQFEMFLQSVMRNDKVEYIGDSYIEKPTPLFNALFLTHHARSHFFDERVSLRQVVDWAMLMRYYGTADVDWKEFEYICREYGLLSFAQTMSRVAKKICHVEIPFDCPANDQLDKMLLDDIFSETQKHVEYGTGMKTRWQILRNKYNARWKYHYFSDQTFASALWQQIWGVISDFAPERHS